MDSNTISFGLLPSSSPSVISSQMIDESKSYTSKSTDEFTNFVDIQQFNKASNGSCSTIDCDHESVCKSSQHPKKTKIIQKQNNLKKQSQKQDQNESSHKFGITPSRNIANKKSHVNNSKNQQHSNAKITQKKKFNLKSHSFVSIFDWMMEIASIMKLTRTVFYRACNIFYETYKINPKVLENSNVQKFVCASLNISAKLQTCSYDFLQELFKINKKRISKQAVSDAQFIIYQTLNWKIPLHSLVSEQVMQVFLKWNSYLEKCEKLGMIRRDTRERLTLCMKNSQNQALKNKIYGQILYILDIMLLNQTKKYMNANSIQNMQKTFFTPIVIAIYSVFTIHYGDTFNKDKYLLPLFKNFYREELSMAGVQIDRFQRQVELSFMIFNFDSYISRIPLIKEWKDVIEKDLLTYLPINVLKKIN